MDRSSSTMLCLRGGWKLQHITFALMIPFGMIMDLVIMQSTS